MSAAPPSPHKIHNLPVIVHYNLPSTSQTFTTLFPSPQQVYVHANATTSDTDTNEDVCGSIYLKTVVQGVITASPELHPCHPSTPDLTLYIHDPRETSLRRSRVSSALPSHLRSTYSSSSLSSSPAGPSHQSPVDVWTGKGLVSWALDEPGLGKQLITGRIVRSASFAGVSSDEGFGGLAALMRADQGEAWGIEVSLCLKSGNERMGGNAFGQVQSAVASTSQTPQMSRAPSSTTSVASRPASKHVFPAGRPPKPVDPGRRATPGRPPGKKNSTTTRKKKCTDTSHAHSASHPQPHTHPRTSPTATSQSSATPRPSSQSQSSDNESFPDDIPAISNTKALTKEQAFRLIQSPAFLNEVTRVTGVRILQENLPGSAKQPNGKRASEGDIESQSAKKPKLVAKPGQTPGAGSTSCAKTPAAENNANILKCWNCGRTKSAVWRTKVMEDGNSVRVCNACGLYWNKNRDMRPPSLWERVDETPRTMKARVATPSDAPASRIDAVTPSVSNSGGLKRTLSHAVEQDAKRIAMSRAKPKGLTAVKPPIAASSPVRPPAPREALPRTKLNQPIAASSPGFRASTPPRTADTFDPVQPLPQDTPNTAIRKMLEPVMQSLSMPLSDDGALGSGQSPQFDWNTDLSAFFDLEGFSLPEVGTEMTLVHSDHVDPTPGGKPVNGSDGTTRSDDVISQLFNPSSIGTSSPAPFDFSQLPPSSPPVMSSDLGHSALLLSSPAISPWERKTSPPKSTAKSAFTPLSEISTNEMARSYSDMGPQTHHTHTGVSGARTDDNPFKADSDVFAGKSMEELFGQMIAQSQSHQREEQGSSTGQVEGMMDDELFSFLEKSLVNN